MRNLVQIWNYCCCVGKYNRSFCDQWRRWKYIFKWILFPFYVSSWEKILWVTLKVNANLRHWLQKWKRRHFYILSYLKTWRAIFYVMPRSHFAALSSWQVCLKSCFFWLRLGTLLKISWVTHVILPFPFCCKIRPLNATKYANFVH